MTFDAIVIGSGQGGNPLAQRMASERMRVALIEERHLGGTCINTGCTPTKTLVASAQVAHYVKNASRWGVRSSGFSADMNAIIGRKNDVVASFCMGQEKRASSNDHLQLFRDHARFTGPHELQVGDQKLRSERIFIDTGARPAIPKLKGLEAVPYLTNETILELREVPEHLIVLGGGYIGLEFAQIFRRFGSEVTVVHRGAEILPREDSEVAALLREALEAEGILFYRGVQTRSIESTSNGLALSIKATGSESGDRPSQVFGTHLLVATGREPNTESLGLASAGIETDEHGCIKVNAYLETTTPGVWALGDVKGGPAFTHISYNDFQIIWANLFEGQRISVEDRIVPYCVFTDPQLGGVGLTEREARARGGSLKVGRVPVTNIARAIERGETAGVYKVVVDGKTDQILGASILAADGGEVVQILHTLMLTKQPYTLLKGAIYIHPTMAEGLFGLLESVKETN